MNVADACLRQAKFDLFMGFACTPLRQRGIQCSTGPILNEALRTAALVCTLRLGTNAKYPPPCVSKRKAAHYRIRLQIRQTNLKLGLHT